MEYIINFDSEDDVPGSESFSLAQLKKSNNKVRIRKNTFIEDHCNK